MGAAQPDPFLLSQPQRRRAGLAPAAFFAAPYRTCLHAIPKQIARRLAQRTASFNRRVQDPPYGLVTGLDDSEARLT